MRYHWRQEVRSPLVILAGILALVMVVAGMVFPVGGNSGHRRSRVSIVKSHLRSLATAIERYQVDHGVYPDARPLVDRVPRRSLLERYGGTDLRTIGPSLTSPIAYLATPSPDRFTDTWSFAYERSADARSGWIAWSPGPDGDYDIREPETLYDPLATVPSAALIERTYDPTNGLDSSGDVWRAKQ